MTKPTRIWIAASKILGRDVSTSEPYPREEVEMRYRQARNYGWSENVLGYEPKERPPHPPSWLTCRLCGYPLDPPGDDGSGTHPTCDV